MVFFMSKQTAMKEELLETQRNNSLHYGSDVGAEMATTYHSVIATVKLHGSSFWNFIGTFCRKIRVMLNPIKKQNKNRKRLVNL